MKEIKPITEEYIWGAIREVGRRFSFTVLNNGHLLNNKSVFQTYEEAETRLQALYPNVIKARYRELREMVNKP